MTPQNRTRRPRMPRPKVTPSILISVLALIVALSSSATAAHVTVQSMKKNSVASKHIKKSAVKPRHIAPRAVRPKHVKPGAIRQAHLAPDVRAQLAQAGVSGLVQVSAKTTVDGYAMTGGGWGSTLAVCPAGKRVVGGGGHWQYSDGGALQKNNSINNSAPRFASGQPGAWNDTSPSHHNGNAWIVTGRNGDDNDPRELVAWAMCANAS